MTDDDPRWDEFCERLDEALTSDDHAGCQNDHRFATSILTAMEYDVANSLAYFEDHGGYCDCEILMNVEQ